MKGSPAPTFPEKQSYHTPELGSQAETQGFPGKLVIHGEQRVPLT